MDKMRLIVAGSRDVADVALVYDELDKVRYDIEELYSGGCSGPDSIARHWCAGRGVSGYRAFVADWNQHGKAAGPIRNQQMVSTGATHLLAFQKNKSKGTQDIINRAIKAGLWVKVINCV
jgi:hypothetical protein